MKVSVPAASFIEFPKEEIELSIPERFERQAAKFPQRVAVKSADGELTYDDLNRAANRLARAILARRGPDEEPVALLFEQGPAAIVAIMGALKAGKIYVPLDPLHFPPAKLAAMLEDSGAALVVTDGKNLALGERLADGAREVIVLDRLDPSANAENPGLVLTADRLAYILYTSGSTGEAKGVAQSHRNVLHFIRNYTNDVNVGPEDRQSLLYSCSVAASVKNIFGALLNGAALVSLNLKAEGPARLAAWLEQEGITLCQMVPTVFRHFAGRLTGREAFPSLRGLYLGGEPLFRRDIELYRAHFPKGCVLVNALASTELNTLRQFFITHETDIADAVVPVGYPVEDTEILLLDESGAAVGPDCVGEIAIRSRYLAVGYWRKPELTRLAFAADTEGSDKRIYRTADLGRMRSDGCLECLGRKDFQVKIRGHRVEIGEIEATLLALANVREAVVVALNESAEEKRLAAYIVPARMPAPDAAELRHALAERLPDYMIPSSFMIAESLPVSAMGKVNVRALTADGGARPSEMPLSVAPTTPLETSLAAIWAETLGKESVGVHDNFFDLGGDSLLAAQILSRTQDLLDIDLPLSVLFEKPTIAELAGYLHRLQSETESRRPRAEADRSLLVRVRAGGDKPPFFYLHGDILRGALYSTNLARYLGDDRPFYALAPHGLNGTEIPPTIAAMADSYIGMLRAVRPRGPYFLSGYCNGGIIAYEMARKLQEQGEAVPLLVVIAARARTAFYRRALHAAIEAAGNVFGSATEQKLHLFVSIRALAHKCRAIYRRLSGGRFHARKATSGDTSEAVALSLGLRVPKAFSRAMGGYVPTPYNGRMLCLWPEEESFGPTKDPTAGWGLVAPLVKLETIPGGHTTCLKYHLNTIAEHMRCAILQAENDSDPPSDAASPPAQESP